MPSAEPAPSPSAPKHVIFLGAGASVSSGYPTAMDLRELMASEEALEKQVLTAIRGIPPGPQHIGSAAQFNQWIDPMKRSLKLFRDGCFGTIDEYCSLVRNANAREVIQLKKILRLVFGLRERDMTKSCGRLG